jgi:hypothetical protein
MRMLRWSNMSRSGFLRSINVERMTTAGPIRPNSKKQPAEKCLQIVGWIDTRRSCADLFPFHSLSIFRLFSLLYGWMQLPPFHFATTNQPGEWIGSDDTEKKPVMACCSACVGRQRLLIAAPLWSEQWREPVNVSGQKQPSTRPIKG